MAITIDQARTWYSGDDPVHDFNHVMRVYHTAEQLAQVERANLEIIHAAALLHDAEGSAPGAETRASHHHHSAQFAQGILEQEGWDQERIDQVLHCIRAHRFRSDGEIPTTIEAMILFDADKLDVLGAIGVARVIGYAAINHQPFYAQPSQQFLASGRKVPGEPHSAYHEYIFKLIKIKERLFTQSAKKLAVEREKYLTEYFFRLKAEIDGRM